MSVSSKVTLTAELKDEISAPLAKVDKNFEQTSKRIEDANKRQGESAASAADVIEKATARATGAQSDMEKALERATGKRSDALHQFEQASSRTTIAEKRLEEVRARADGGSASVLSAEKNLEAARYKQVKALDAVSKASGDLEEAQAALLEQNAALANADPIAPAVNTKQRNEALGELAPAATVVGGAMSLGFGKMLNTYASFDKAMSQVKAFTQESDANMALLREAAISAGADTAYSAEEAAGAINELGKAGVSTQDILNGGLNGAMSLAAAGELEVSKAAEIASTAMTQFKLSGDQIPHLADLLAAGAGKAMGSVEDLGAALGQTGLVASATGLNIEETTGTLAAFASNGLLGSDAGTSMKTMLQRLTPQSKQAAKEMEALGISAYDANGEFIGMSEFAGVLQNSMKDLTDEQRMASMGIMFGSDAVRAANVLYEQGADGISNWTKEVNDSGYAAKTAADLQNNLAGDLEKLGGSFDTVFLQSGSGANDALRGLVQTAEDFVDMIGQIPGPVLSFIGVLTGVTGGALLLGGGLVMLMPKIMDTIGGFRDLQASGSRVPGVMGKVSKGVGLATAAFILLQAAVAANNAEAPDARGVEDFAEAYLKARDKVADVGDSFKNMKFADGSALAGQIDNVGDALSRLNPKFGDVRGHLASFGATNLGAENGLPDLKRELEGISDVMATAVSDGDFEGASSVFRQMVESAEAGGKSISDLTPYMGAYLDSLRNVAHGVGETVTEQELLAWAMNGVEPAAVTVARATQDAADATGELGKVSGPTAEQIAAMEEELAEVGLTLDGVISNMDKFLDLLFATGLATMSSRDAQVNYQEALRGIDKTVDELIEKNGNLSGVLNKNATDFDLTTEAGASANSAFQDLARGGMDQVKAMANEGLGQDKIQEKLKGTYTDLIGAADAFGITGQAGIDLARDIMGIPDGVSIDSWMEETAKETAESTKAALGEIPGMTEIGVAVSENGTVGEVQSKINGVTGKQEHIFVGDNGTTAAVQQAIVNVNGVNRTVWVDDNGTIISTQGEIDAVRGKQVTITVDPETGVAERALKSLAAPRTSTLTVYERFVPGAKSPDQGPIASQFGGGYTGGLVGQLINGHAGGGLVPGVVPLNSHGDNILATVNGKPFGLRSGEMVVNEPATRANLPLLKAMNAGAIVNLPGLAGGGLVSRFAGGGIPDTVPNTWVDEFKPSLALAPAPPSLAPSPSRGRSGGNITLSEGAVQVTVPAGTGMDPDELGRIVQEAVMAAMETKQEQMEQAY
ncbi:phage tail tape measure protein [Glutamicibacter ardleyensis]|uniref:phage tail tape measure protein n=1 Tax=Glutamicibacter ardleyensis TaxID=225894 RepID=UPI003FCF2805